jgi:hemolysin D
MPLPFQDSSEISPDNKETQHIQSQPGNEQEWYYGTEELLDALPRVWTRSLLYLILAFTAIIIPWSMVSKVDETGMARGKIEPKGSTQRIDSSYLGNVIAVKVKEGDKVIKDQVLLELDTEELKTQLQEIKAKLEGYINQRQQIELIKNQLKLSLGVQEQQNQSQQQEKIAQINQVKQNLDTKISTFNIQRLEKQSLVDQAKQTFKSTNITQQLASRRYEQDFKEINRYLPLVKQGAIPSIKVTELEKIATASEQSLKQAVADSKQAELRIQEEESRYQGIMSQAQADIDQAKLRVQEEESGLKSITKAGELLLLKTQEQFKELETQIINIQSQIEQTQKQAEAINLQMRQRVVRSPINGTIYQLPISKPGSVLQPGQMIAQIAPSDVAFILKAQIPTQESGFLKQGMSVKVKFDSYPFQEYGIVQGTVDKISPDTKKLQTPQGQVETYELDIALPQPYIKSGNKTISLKPGETATAEVIIRQQRIIDYLLEPFKKLQKDGLKL